MVTVFTSPSAHIFDFEELVFDCADELVPDLIFELLIPV